MNTLSLLPLGEIEPRTMAALSEALWKAFGVEVRTLPPLPVPDAAYDAQREQYSSSRILTELLSLVPSGGGRILGVTDRDLFIPMLSFVFGHAQFKGRAALVSRARLDQRFYRLPDQPELTEVRTIKEAVHEIGHTFGLTHCTSPRCPMSLSNTIFQVDGKTADLCGGCSILLEQALLTYHDRTPMQTENRL